MTDLRQKPPLIALIGGICSGKSTVAQAFKSLGAGIIDTDHIARALLQAQTPEFQAVLDHFGPEIINAQGQLNRARLKEMIFKNPDDKTWLENLLHPRIRAEVDRLSQNTEVPYWIVLIPLLKSRSAYDLDYVLSLEIARELQLQRLQARDAISQTLAETIIAAQPNSKDRALLADQILENSGPLETLEPEIKRLDLLFRNMH